MRKLIRPNAPDFLTEKLQVELGERYKKNREKNKGHQFNYWHTEKVGESTLYKEIRNKLIEISDDHCFYCDGYPPLGDDDTIDHFKPKSKPEFYDLVCSWENLYLACGHCQKAKGTEYNDFILRPDEINYEFDKFFKYDSDNDEVIINLGADELSQLRAEKTIEVFDFNHVGLKKLRGFFRKVYSQDPQININDLGYRFCLNFQQTI